MAKFRKKPVIIEAEQFTGDISTRYFAGVVVGQTPCKETEHGLESTGPTRFVIETLEGDMEVKVGDWVITGVKGEHYPCRKDIFEATYEPVSEVVWGPEGGVAYGK